MVTSAVAIIEPHLIDIGSGVHIVGKELVECYVSMREKCGNSREDKTEKKADAST